MIDVKCFPMAGVQNYTVEDFQSYLGSRASGVFSAADNLAVSAQASPDMTVKVSAGLAWLRFDDLRGVSFPLFAAEDIAIAPADALQDRIDTVVIGLDRTLRKGYLKAVTGLLGGGATAPVRDSNYYELVLAEVLVSAGSVVVLSSQITDKRADEAVCGFMRNDIEQVVNNLSTADQTKVLSAAMGKQLQDEKAPKAAPTFTGTVTIPTAAVATLNAGTANANVVYSPSFTGMVAFFAGTNTPAGWLKCDGAVVSRTTYANLFTFIGTVYNTGGEAGTDFRLPNLCDGSFIRGVGGNAAAIGVKQADEFKSHNHPDNPAGASNKAGAGALSVYDRVIAGQYTGNAGGVETRPLNTSMTPYIKY